MGMKSMFQDTADFGGIFEKKNKEKVTKFQQTSLIDVDEDGTGPGAGVAAQAKKSSAAAGGSQNSDNSGGNPENVTNGTVSILVDHPFMYFIVDRRNNIMLLSGIHAKF